MHNHGRPVPTNSRGKNTLLRSITDVGSSLAAGPTAGDNLPAKETGVIMRSVARAAGGRIGGSNRPAGRRRGDRECRVLRRRCKLEVA